MTLAQLRHLLSLAETGSFSKSSKALFLTQPALSRSIQALEDELGLPLFDRIGRRNELTPLGREVVERARQIVDGANEIKSSGQLLSEGRAGHVRLGMSSGPGAMLMTPLLHCMATQHPGIRIEIARGNTELLTLALRERKLDALVVDARSLKPAPDLATEVLHEMRGAFLCRQGHPLTARQKAVSFAELGKYPIASTPLSDEVARILMGLFGPEAHPDQFVTLRCDELHSLIEVVRSSDTVLLAIRQAAPDLAEIQMQPALAAMARFGLVKLAGRTSTPALHIVRELMRELLRD
ncbi:MAG: LysR substrate-binding domain-containing protein [Hylemonella sp.]